MDYDRLDKLIDKALNYETDNYLANINLRRDVSDMLLMYQHRHVFTLLSAFRHNNVVLDGSDTGTGKTYTAAAVCKQLRWRPFIICPKSIISNWNNVCKQFGITPLGISNYNSVKAGKQYDKDGNKILSPYLTISEDFTDERMFKWNLPKYTLVIFDEVHLCNNPKTIQGKLLKSTKNLDHVLMISATISDKPETFGIYGYMFGFYDSTRKATGWIKGMLRDDKRHIGIGRLNSINKAIYPEKGSRMRISELGDKFPANQISAISYNIGSKVTKQLNEIFESIKEGLIKLKVDKLNNSHVLAEITKARMKIELYKVPIFTNLIREFIDNGFAVVVFVNYKETLTRLATSFGTTSVVHGDQTMTERDNVVENFQMNNTNIIICTIGSGALGLSLHDLHGVPRVSLISPTYSSIQLTQALGRIHRAGAKTPAIQRLIYSAGTCEEAICARVNAKLKFTADLNDNDLIEIK